MITPEFSGTIVVTSPRARAEIVGLRSVLDIRFATLRDLLAFRADAAATATLLRRLPEGMQVRIEVRGREIGRLGAAPAGRWSASGIAARLSGWPVIGIRPLWWLGR